MSVFLIAHSALEVYMAAHTAHGNSAGQNFPTVAAAKQASYSSESTSALLAAYFNKTNACRTNYIIITGGKIQPNKSPQSRWGGGGGGGGKLTK